MNLDTDAIDTVEVLEDSIPPLQSPTKRAVPLKVFIQTVWVIIDDQSGTVTEHTDGGVTIPASEWPTFYERWANDFAILQENVANSI